MARAEATHGRGPGSGYSFSKYGPPSLYYFTLSYPLPWLTSGNSILESYIYRRNKDVDENVDPASADSLFDPNPWFREIVDDYRELNPSELVPGIDSGAEFTSVCINTAIYLPWLLGQCLKAGVVVKRGVLSHIREAKTLSQTGRPADIIINTTGLGARKLGGVEDKTMTASRAQIVVVRNESSPMISVSGTDDEPADLIYLMQRAAGGGTILGGTYDMDNWDSVPDPNTALRIMERIVKIRPEIADGKGIKGLSVIRHAVGLRPYRKGSVRIEEENLDEETWVVHNYGHAGWGYQGSYGCAEGVVELVNKIRSKERSKL